MIAPGYPVTDIRTWLTDGVRNAVLEAYEDGFGHALSHPDLYKIDGDRYWNGETGIGQGASSLGTVEEQKRPKHSFPHAYKSHLLRENNFEKDRKSPRKAQAAGRQARTKPKETSQVT